MAQVQDDRLRRFMEQTPEQAEKLKRERLRREKKEATKKHVQSWLVLAAGLPVIVAAMAVWYLAVKWFTDLLANHLAWLNEWVLGDFIDEFVSAAGGLVLALLAEKFNRISYDIYPSKRYTRYIVTGVIAGCLTVAGAVCAITGKVPAFLKNYESFGGMAFSVLFAMGVYTYKMISESIEGRRDLKNAPNGMKTVCVFGYTKNQTGASFKPFCYFTGFTGLLNADGSLNEARENDASYREEYFKMRVAALDARNCPPEALRGQLAAFMGIEHEGKIYFIDRMLIDAKTGRDAYAAVFDAADKEKPVMGMETKELKGIKRFSFGKNGKLLNEKGKAFNTK